MSLTLLENYNDNIIRYNWKKKILKKFIKIRKINFLAYILVISTLMRISNNINKWTRYNETNQKLLL